MTALRNATQAPCQYQTHIRTVGQRGGTLIRGSNTGRGGGGHVVNRHQLTDYLRKSLLFNLIKTICGIRELHGALHGGVHSNERFLSIRALISLTQWGWFIHVRLDLFERFNKMGLITSLKQFVRHCTVLWAMSAYNVHWGEPGPDRDVLPCLEKCCSYPSCLATTRRSGHIFAPNFKNTNKI